AEGRDAARGSVLVDAKRLARAFARVYVKRDPLVVEGHLGTALAVDVTLVLRVAPEVLGARLRKRGYGAAKIRENVEAEALDVVAGEVQGTRAFEIDATRLRISAVADVCEALLRGGDPGLASLGTVAWPLEKHF